MKLSYSEVFNNMFQHSMRKLTSFPSFPIKLAYNVNRISDKVEGEIKQARLHVMNELKKHVKVDEKGNVELTDPKNPSSFAFTSPEAEKAFAEQEAEFMKGSFEIDREQLKIEDLDAAGFKASATELQALMPIIKMGELEAVK